MYTSTLLSAASVIAMATAQRPTGPPFEYRFPPSRGSDSVVAGIGPCQGFEVGSRIEYPISGGSISWATTRDIKDVRVRVSSEVNPVSQDQFQDALTNVTGGWVGAQCVDAPNFEEMGFEIGQDLTIQFAYTSGRANSEFFACSDVTLVDADTFAAKNYDIQCTNRVDTLQVKNSMASNPQYAAIMEEQGSSGKGGSESEAESGSASKGLSLAEAGVIGAMTTLGVVALLALFSWWAGVIAYGRNLNVQAPPTLEKQLSAPSV